MNDQDSNPRGEYESSPGNEGDRRPAPPLKKAKIPTFFEEHPLGRFSRMVASARGMDCFGSYLRGLPDSGHYAGILSRFSVTAPWRYWRKETVDTALSVLEKDSRKTAQGIERWGFSVARGVRGLLQPAKCAFNEDSICQSSPRELVLLANQFHPEYLRIDEHVFGNLIRVFWSTTGKAKGKFDPRGACASLESRGLSILLAGHSEPVRNALAHGTVSFRGEGVRYYSDGSHYTELQANEFLNLYDELIMTSNALLIALLLFWFRNNDQLLGSEGGLSVPAEMIVWSAATRMERKGFEVIGMVESNYAFTGEQLQVSVRTKRRSRHMAFLDSLYLATALYRSGADRYNRYVFAFDQGEPVPSIVPVDLKALEAYFAKGGQTEYLAAIFGENPLLWFDEPRWVARLGIWLCEALAIWSCYCDQVLRNLYENKAWRATRRYNIRNIKTIMHDGTLRLDVTAVLKFPDDTSDPELVKEIVASLVGRLRRRPFVPPHEFLSARRWMPRRPSYIWVRLYRDDRTLRSLSRGGWQEGNLVSVAEWKSHSRLSPILIKKPQSVFRNIAFKFEIDKQEYAEALQAFAELYSKLHEESAHDDA